MPIHVKKINLALAFSIPLSLAWTSPSFAQDEAAPAPATPTPKAAPAPAPAPAAPAAPQTDTQTLSKDFFHEQTDDGTLSKTTNQLLGILGNKLEATDLAHGSGADAGLHDRFETYLSLQAVPDDRIKDYFGKMDQVREALKAGSTFPAWKILHAMSEYTDLDAGISLELANRVEAIWNSDKTQGGLELANDKLRDNVDTYTHNADMVADDLHQQDLQENAKVGNGKGGGGGNQNQSNTSVTNSALQNPMADPVAAEASMMPTMSGALQRKMELTGEYLKLLEARADIKLNEMKEHKMDTQAQADFASYIDTLFKTHRYYHVILAADFYRALFTDGDYPVDMQNEVNTSLETNERVSQNIEVFKYKAGLGQVAGAADELQTAFLDNEFHPGLKGLARADKAKVDDFMNKLSVLKSQIEVHDYEEVDSQLDDIKKVASDFDTTRPLALVNDIKLESSFRLGHAKLLAQQGQLTEAMQEFKTAGEQWPGNPDLKTAAKLFFGSEDTKNQSTDDFDRMVTAQDYRGIFDKQIQFATAVHGDATREQQLKDALLKVQKAEMASEKANMLVMNGDVDGAWETIEAATKDWPDDLKLNKLLADLSSRSADFVSAVNKARDAQSKKEYGYSLTWYVNAQSYYPASTIALAGIDTVSKLILSPHGDSTAQD
jgi:tetratricopeptide (TPR) repeat protein